MTLKLKISLVYSFPHDLQSILKEICLICMRQSSLEVPWHKQHINWRRPSNYFGESSGISQTEWKFYRQTLYQTTRIYGYYRLKRMNNVAIDYLYNKKHFIVFWSCALALYSHSSNFCHICLHWRLGLCLLMPLNKHFTPKEAFKSRVTIYFPPEMSTSTLWRSQTVLILEHTSFCLISVRVRCPPPTCAPSHSVWNIPLVWQKHLMIVSSRPSN